MNSDHCRNVQRDFAHVARAESKQANSQAGWEARKFVAWIRPAKGSLVLDAACGAGNLAQALASAGSRVTAIDLTPEMIRAATAGRSRTSARPYASFALGNVESLPYPSSQFDLVTCSYAFANFPDPLEVLEEFVRVVRSDGRIALAEVVAPGDPACSAQLNRIEALRGHVYTRVMRHSEFLELFRRARLHLIRSRLGRHAQSLRKWLQLSPAAVIPKRARLLRRMVLDSAPDNQAGLDPRRVNHDIIFYHSTAWFLLRRP